MPSQYNGNASNITRVIFVNIQSSTNASPIVVQTSSAHGLATNDSVIVGGHQVNTAANGRWTVTVVDSTHIQLNGSTGNGVGAATGSVYLQSLGATYAIPSDGDARNAASVNVGFQALGDRTAFLGRQVAVGGSQVANLTSQSINDNTPSFASWGTITGNALGAAWKPLMVGGSQLVWTVPNLINGDSVDVNFTTSAQQNFNANALLAIWYQQVSPGGTFTAGTKVQGSGQIIPWSGANPTPLNLRGRIGCGTFGASSDPGGSLIVCVQGYMPNSGADVVTLYSDYLFTATVLRQNG